jgi:AhpC/TSA family
VSASPSRARAAVLSIGMLALLPAGCAPAAPPASAQLSSLGARASFSAPDARGDLVHVPGAAPRATVVELWAADCEPCRWAIAALAAEAPRLEADGIDCVLVGVLDAAEPIDRGREALRAWGVDRAFLVDRGGGVQRALGIATLPATVVLDRAGVVRWVAPAGARPATVTAAARWIARGEVSGGR